jgi:hypothetical protein
MSDRGTELNLEDFDPHDPSHLFWDQIKQLGFALRDIRREDVSDEQIDDLLKASEPIMTILARIQRHRERRKQQNYQPNQPVLSDI